MPVMTVAQEREQPIDLFYQDLGDGDPVVLIHGWPLSSLMWERQIPALLDARKRVIAYDRRGFGRSSQPGTGYDYDTMAADLNALMTKLDLTNVTLVGFSMGGGEVARYVGKYGTARIKKTVLMSATTPFLMQTDDNPVGVPQAVLQDIADGLAADRVTFLDGFVRQFFNYGTLKHHGLNETVIRYCESIAWQASPIATRDCAKAFSSTDFRKDLETFDIPTLVMHGDADQIVPMNASGQIAAEMIAGAQFEVIEGAPHGMTLTHSDTVNELLMKFVES